MYNRCTNKPMIAYAPIANDEATERARNNIIAALPPKTQLRLSAGIAARYQKPITGMAAMGINRCAAR